MANTKTEGKVSILILVKRGNSGSLQTQATQMYKKHLDSRFPLKSDLKIEQPGSISTAFLKASEGFAGK